VAAEPADKATAASLIQVIANPDRYSGKRVVVIGYANIEFEGEALYLHEEDHRQALITNSVRLDVPSAERFKEWQRLGHTYVLVEGRFNAQRRGRPGAAAGTLEDISRFEKWPSRAEHRARTGLPKEP